MKGSFSPSAASFYQATGQKDNRLETSVDLTPPRKAAQRLGVHGAHTHDLLRGLSRRQSEELQAPGLPSQATRGFPCNGLWLHWKVTRGEGGVQQPALGAPRQNSPVGSKLN